MNLPRRRLWFVLLTGLVLAGGVWVWALSCSVWCKNAERITVGMSRSDVLVIMMKPPTEHIPDFHADNPAIKMVDRWKVVDGLITVAYDSDQKVVIQEAYSPGFFTCQLHR